MQLHILTSPPATHNNDFYWELLWNKRIKNIEKSCLLVGRSVERDRNHFNLKLHMQDWHAIKIVFLKINKSIFKVEFFNVCKTAILATQLLWLKINLEWIIALIEYF